MLNKTVLILGLTIAISASADNLLNSTMYNGSEFANGWSGTNDHNHGNSIVAGEHNKYLEATVNASQGLTETQIKNGFTSTLQADVWHWNNTTSNTEFKQTIIGTDGSVITQTRDITGEPCGYNNCGSYITYSDDFIVGNNASATDYAITSRFTFTESTQSDGHWGVDLRNPSLVLSPSLLTATEVQEITKVLEDLVIKDFILNNFEVLDVPVMDVKVEETPYFEDLTIEFEEELVVFNPEPMPIEEMSVEAIEPEFEEVMIIEEAPVMEATEETMEIKNAEETREEPRTDVSRGEGETRGRAESPTQTASAETSQVLGLEVDNIQDAVSVKIPRVADQLKAVQYLVAKAMQSTNGLLKEYTNVNNSLFDNQPTIDGGNLDVYTSISYVDIRNIYPNNNYPDREVIWTSR